MDPANSVDCSTSQTACSETDSNSLTATYDVSLSYHYNINFPTDILNTYSFIVMSTANGGATNSVF